jgi:hypothetical protein
MTIATQLSFWPVKEPQETLAFRQLEEAYLSALYASWAAWHVYETLAAQEDDEGSPRLCQCGNVSLQASEAAHQQEIALRAAYLDRYAKQEAA